MTMDNFGECASIMTKQQERFPKCGHQCVPMHRLEAWTWYSSRSRWFTELFSASIEKSIATIQELINVFILIHQSKYLVGVSLSLHTRFLATKSGWMLLGPRSNNTGLKRMYQETMISASNKEPVAKNLGFYIHHSCTSSGWKPMFWHSSINLTLRLNQLTHDPPHPRIPAPPPYLLSWRSNVASSIINIYMSSINLLTQLKSPKTYPRCARKSTFFRDLACRVSSETAGHSLKSTGKYMEPLHFVWEKIPRCLFFNGRDLKRMETTHDSTDSFVCTF